MFLFFLFLLLLIGVLVFYYIQEQKMMNQKKQLMLLAKQNKTLKTKVNEHQSVSNGTVIRYKAPLYKEGKVGEDCTLYIAPLESSIVLSNLRKDSIIDILDSAEVLNTLWFEVTTRSEVRVNNKGWVKAQYVVKVEEAITLSNNQITQ